MNKFSRLKKGSMTNCVYGTLDSTYSGNVVYMTTGLLTRVTANQVKLLASDALHPWGWCPSRRFKQVIGTAVAMCRSRSTCQVVAGAHDKESRSAVIF